MADIFKEGVDLYIPMGTYSDPKRFINGEACKALITLPYDNNNLPLGFCTLKYFGYLPEVKDIIITGPKDRLEKKLEEHRKELPDKRIIVRQESSPGNLQIALEDMAKAFLDPSLNLTEYVMIASSDYARLNADIATIIFNDFRNILYTDIINGVKTEMYMAVGNQIEDNEEYGRVRNIEVERKGIILGPSKAWRFGNSYLLRSDLIRNKNEEVNEMIIHSNMRKIKDDITGSIDYWVRQLFTKGKEEKTKKAAILSKALLNYVKKHLLNDLAPYPYFTISEHDCNAIVSDVLGINLKFVETLGSADIDDNFEFEAALKTHKDN